MQANRETPVQARNYALINPYSMSKHSVRTRHFRDARLYDSQIMDPHFARACNLDAGTDLKQWRSEWKVQRTHANRKYREWVLTIRSRDGFHNFRRERPIVDQEYIDTSAITFNKLDADNAAQLIANAFTNRSHNLSLAQSKEKGINPDDQDFVPRVFTQKMGKDIAQIRSSLNLTQAQLGNLINVDAITIKNVESGGVIPFNPNSVTTKKLAKALGLATIIYQE